MILKAMSRSSQLVVLASLALLTPACADLGVVIDGGSVSLGRTNRGALAAGAVLPESGEGFGTREVWKTRGRRLATDELVDLLVGVGRRLKARGLDARLIVADMSQRGGGPANPEHRSHQSGRDADLLYFMRDADGHPVEADAMHAFDGAGKAKDGSGLTLDVPRTWLLVRALVEAPEAEVQYVFMYEPFARRLLDHARDRGEPEAVIARARRALVQPGDSAPHNDHLHVRVYCSADDRLAGCVDAGAHLDDRLGAAPMALSQLPQEVRGQLAAALVPGGSARGDAPAGVGAGVGAAVLPPRPR
jgi:penicillin-insensitive murein endopeptidase